MRVEVQRMVVQHLACLCLLGIGYLEFVVFHRGLPSQSELISTNEPQKKVNKTA